MTPNTEDQKFAGFSHRRALELILAGLHVEQEGLQQQIRMIEETLANGNPGYGHLPPIDGEEAGHMQPYRCSVCGDQGHNKATCPSNHKRRKK